MIIAFAGRYRSGKSELSKVCETMGYKKIYFALPLKQLCADLLNVSIEELNELKNNYTEINFRIDEGICDSLSKETDIPIENVKDVCLDKTITTVREMLQFIGTDLIRRYNSDWHVEKTRQMIDSGYDYVIDDVRFPNEKKMVEDLGGDCWFVIRPDMNNISHHASEESLKWQDFGNKVIINNINLTIIKNVWGAFVKNYTNNVNERELLFDDLQNAPSGKKVKLLINDSILSYDPTLKEKDITEIEYKNDFMVVKLRNKCDMLFVANPYVMEDLKFFI